MIGGARRAALALFAVFVSLPAAAETFSIRCDAHEAKKSYVLTFDTDAGSVIYESSVGNLHPGRITSLNDLYIAFTLRAAGGDIPAQWAAKSRTVHWPGFWSDAARPSLDHHCMVIALRTILVVARETGGAAPMPSAPFSLKCDSEPFPSHFTFDRAAKLAVMESMAGRLIRGEIQEAETGRIRFSIDDGGEPFKMTWDKQRAIITVEGVPGESSRPTTACVEIAPRSIMVLHNRLQ